MDFKSPFRLDFIRKTSYGSIFQGLIAVFMFLQYRWSGFSDLGIMASLGWIFTTQAIRFLVYQLFRKSDEQLLKAYVVFACLSSASAIGWGLVGLFGLIGHGMTGIGMISVVACTSVACATAHAASGVLIIQRIYTVIILLLPTIGLIVQTLPNPDWMTVSLIGVVALYCFYLAQKQNGMMRILYEQRERISRDLQAARTIQQALLPELKQEVGNFKIEVLYQPCEDLSGDFFEIQSVGDHILFYVADVTSHGTAAAQVTYLLKGLFRNVLPEQGAKVDVNDLTKKLAIGYSAYGLNYSISLFMGCLNMKSGQLEFISSNFPQPVLIEKDKSRTISTGANPIIDAMLKDEAYNFVIDQLQIQPGASLFVFTDGAFELKSKEADKNLNERELRKILAQGTHSNWGELILSQLKSINQTANFPDDITIMKIQHTGIHT